MALTPDERQYGGNDGYHDDVSRFYSWNSRVPNADKISTGDRVVLWDKKGLLGYSTVDRITTGTGTIDRRMCPDCGTSNIKYRKTKSPDWRCFVCHGEFGVAKFERVDVVTYRADYEADWVDAPSVLSAAVVRRLALSPKSQHAMRETDWEAFRRALKSKTA
jgi:hypothetical protein